jgi:hypothetical protein
MNKRAASKTGAFAAIRRRDLLVGIGVVALLAGSGIALETSIAAADSGAPPVAFIQLSQFITGADLTDGPAMARAWTQLSALDTGFPAAVAHLHSAVASAGFKAMADFLASPLAKDAAVLKTVSAITAAWYLGYTGTPGSLTMTDNTGFVTYTGALMWRPTAGLMVIPTYSLGATNYWVDPPAGTAIPKNIKRDWTGSTPRASSHKDA